MNLDEAIRTALDFENKVRAVYLDAARKAKDDTGKRVKEAGPSKPVQITGLADVPVAGDVCGEFSLGGWSGRPRAS